MNNSKEVNKSIDPITNDDPFKFLESLDPVKYQKMIEYTDSLVRQSNCNDIKNQTRSCKYYRFDNVLHVSCNDDETKDIKRLANKIIMNCYRESKDGSIETEDKAICISSLFVSIPSGSFSESDLCSIITTRLTCDQLSHQHDYRFSESRDLYVKCVMEHGGPRYLSHKHICVKHKKEKKYHRDNEKIILFLFS